jgi:hypothetical protein
MKLKNTKKTNRMNLTLSMLFSEFFWDGIDSACMPGVAFQQSPYGKIGTSDSAEPLDGGQGIAGTGGMEAAMLAHPRADQETVELDEGEQDGLHCFTRLSQCFCNELLSAS